jgi:hypothetical protein
VWLGRLLVWGVVVDWGSADFETVLVAFPDSSAGGKALRQAVRSIVENSSTAIISEYFVGVCFLFT